MTRISKSPEQYDAEAAAPRDNRSLQAVLLRHRAMFRQDTYIPRIATETPPVIIDGETGERTSDPNHVGMTWSAAFERRILAPGRQYPWADAFRALGQMCRGVHHAHRDRTEFRGSLCRALVSLVIIGDQPIGRAARTLGIEPARAGLTLRTALLWMEAEQSRQAQRQLDRERAVEGARMAREDAGYVAIPVHQHVPLDGLHRSECQNAVCRKERAA